MPKKVCLVDGSGYIFRAFYALPPMTNPAGLPVNAVYGFTNMFLKLTSQIKCDYSLVLFDAKRKNFRNEIFPDYKGTRKEIPEDLIPQFELIHNAVSALNLNYLEMDGFEADDLIATYAAEALKKGYEVVIVSGDKDLMQLIRPGVEFYDPMKDKFFTPEDVREKFGVYPERVTDVQALAGDSGTSRRRSGSFRRQHRQCAGRSRNRSEDRSRTGQSVRFAGGSSGTCRRNQTKQTPRNAAGQSGQRKDFQAAGSAQKRRAGRT